VRMRKVLRELFSASVVIGSILLAALLFLVFGKVVDDIGHFIEASPFRRKVFDTIGALIGSAIISLIATGLMFWLFFWIIERLPCLRGCDANSSIKPFPLMISISAVVLAIWSRRPS
jgi:drug/metabolite transporter (DMT)-like permease